MDKEKIFKLFTGKDELRPVFDEPFIVGEYVYATDSRYLIMTDKKLINFDVKNQYNKFTREKMESIIPKTTKLKKLDIDLNYFESLKTADEYENHEKRMNCDECDGFGVVDWEYNNYTREDDCPVCYGTGGRDESKMVKTGRKTYIDCRVKISDAYFDIHIFDLLLKVMSITNESSYIASKIKPNEGVKFKVGEYYIVLMPVHNRDYKAKIIKLDYEAKH